ncbi:MAG: MarR family transcriptional regulator [Lachnospiraceae bacterium]|nr:MarR family transcriptional regulator [Lachnospiraceae bacterium]
MEDKYAALKLENQVCFPLYACAKEVVKKYKPYLEPLDLTYTQYIAMMVLWEHKSITVKQLGEYLYLDSGTLTPVLKKIEAKGYVVRERSREDERSLEVRLTREGEQLKEQAVKIPVNMGSCIRLTQEEKQTLYQLLYKVLGYTEEHHE